MYIRTADRGIKGNTTHNGLGMVLFYDTKYGFYFLLISFIKAAGRNDSLLFSTIFLLNS